MSLQDSIARRLARLREINANPAAIPIELELCRRDVLHWFHWWAWTYDPRRAEDGDLPHLPFDLFPRQKELVQWFDERLRLKEEGLLEKSRDIGFTWLAGGYAFHKWRFAPGFKTTFGSRKEEFVDKVGDADSIFEKIRLIIRTQPKWMLPKGLTPQKHFNHMRIINPENENLIRGESGDEMGRGGRSTMYFIDEAAFIERAERVDAATSANTDTRIWGSTVNGPGNFFARKRFGGSLKPRQIFRFHYTDNPLMTPERLAKKQSELEPHQFASEYDIDYSASVEGICIPAKWVESAKKIAKLIKIEPLVNGIAGGDVGAGKAKSVVVPRFGPVVGLPTAWGDPDTIETAHRMLDACEAARAVRSDGTVCKITSLRFDNIGPGEGVTSALSRANRPGLITTGVNVGVPPSEMVWPDGETSEEKFVSLKAEAWWLMRDRFKSTHEMVLHLEGKPGGQSHPASELISLPDDADGPEATVLASQIGLVKWMRNEKGKIQIEPKAQLAKRGIASPDYAEALVLTFTADSTLETWMKLAQ